MLDSTVEAVNGALKRARARPAAPTARGEGPAAASPAANSSAEAAIVAKFVSAYESADLDALVALLTDDVFISMPPMPFEYEGRDVVARFCDSIFRAGRRFDLVRTRANGQPAFGAYLRAPTGVRHGVGLIVLTVAGDRICAMARFESSVLPWPRADRRSSGRITSSRSAFRAAAIRKPRSSSVARCPSSNRRTDPSHARGPSGT